MTAVLTSPFAPIIAQHGRVIVDGAMATELERRGADLHDSLWSASVLLRQPALVRAVHDSYFAAGADVVITATYQATFEGLAARGFSAEASAAVMQQSVKIACDARDVRWKEIASLPGACKPMVAASVGPYGAFLADGAEYRGQYSLDEHALVSWHRARFRLLVDSGADLLACETIPCLSEVRAMLRLLDAYPMARAWITCTARDGAHIASGELFAQVAREAGAHPQVVAVGVNCTAPTHITSLIHVARAVTEVPIIVYPNSGEEYDATAKRWIAGPTCESLADSAAEWIAAGATLIGGCCRTTPADIAALRAATAR